MCIAHRGAGFYKQSRHKYTPLHSERAAFLFCISLCDVADCANSVGFRGSVPLLPYLCPLSVPEVWGMWGIFRKPLKRAIWDTLGLHAVLRKCLRFSSVLDDACVACCLFLATGSYHVFIQVDFTGCCFPQCTTKAFNAEKGSPWGCRVGAGGSALAWQLSKKAPYSRFAATCMHPQGTPDSDHRRGRFFCKSILGW